MLCTRFGLLYVHLWHRVTHLLTLWQSAHHSAHSIGAEYTTAAFVQHGNFHGNLCMGKRDRVLLVFPEPWDNSGLGSSDLELSGHLEVQLPAPRKSCFKDKMRLLKALASVACLFRHCYYRRTGAFGGFLKRLLPTGTGQPVLKEARTW